jgi:hypothetical protein
VLNNVNQVTAMNLISVKKCLASFLTATRLKLFVISLVIQLCPQTSVKGRIAFVTPIVSQVSAIQ